jgi:hypothetical protein
MKPLYILLFIGFVFTGMICSNQVVYASSSFAAQSVPFLALVQKINVETHLVEPNISSNITLAQEHAGKAIEYFKASNVTKEISAKNNTAANDLTTALADLQNATKSKPISTTIKEKVHKIDAILDEAVRADIDKQYLNNTTIQSQVLANILKETLDNYGRNTIGVGEGIPNNTMLSVGNYQSAQAFASKAEELFTKLIPLANASVSPAIGQIDDGIIQLRQDIDNHKSFNDVAGLVNSKIYPSLQIAFNSRLVT